MNLSTSHKYLALGKRPSHFPRWSNCECNMLRGQEKFCAVAIHLVPSLLLAADGGTQWTSDKHGRGKICTCSLTNARLMKTCTKTRVSNSTGAKLFKKQPCFTAITSLSWKNMRLIKRNGCQALTVLHCPYTVSMQHQYSHQNESYSLVIAMPFLKCSMVKLHKFNVITGNLNMITGMKFKFSNLQLPHSTIAHNEVCCITVYGPTFTISYLWPA